MAGQGHQFPTGFPNPAGGGGMRGNFGAGAIGGGLQAQMGSHMPGQMMPGMPGMMNQQYNQNMPTQSQSMMHMQHQHSMQQNLAQATPPAQSPASLAQNNNTSSGLPPTAISAPTPAQNKEFNTVTLSRLGQETVQDIVSRIQEVFQTLKTIQPPNGTVQGVNSANEKKAKVQEQLRTIRLLFKRLRLIFEKCNENCQLQGMEYTHIESLIPLKEDPDQKPDERWNSEGFKAVVDENKELTEQVVQKNRQLKEVIDHLRRIIWEINTMLNMRRS